MITYIEDKNNKRKKKYKKYKTITTTLKSFDTFVMIATTTSPNSLNLTGIGLIVIPKSTATACELSIGNKVIYEIIINKCNNYKKQYEKDQQTVRSLDKFYRKSLQDSVIDRNENEKLRTIFTNMLMK